VITPVQTTVQMRLRHFFLFSMAGHLIALTIAVLAVRNASLRLAPLETVCFVNMSDLPLGGGNSREKKGGGSPKAKPLPGPPAPVSVARAREIAPVPRRSPAENAAAPVAANRPAKAVSSVAPAASPASHGGGVSGVAAKAAAAGGGGMGGSGGTGGSGKGTGSEGEGSGGGGQPGEVGFGTATGISYAHQVKPFYPALARRFNREGKVLLRLTVSESGALTAVEVMDDPGYGFAAAAVEAVRKSRYNPARRAGRPFAARAYLPVRFVLNREE